MDFLNSMDISQSGLTSQRQRMNLVAMNLSHINTTRTPDGGPYRRKVAIFETAPYFSGARGVRPRLEGELQDCQVREVMEDRRDFKLVYDPSHPDADEFGYVLMPNINVVEEMVGMISAKRSYEANIAAATAAQSMALKSLELLK
ncbi:MAG: flagellar basal body rod protein FlgC [Candidatus Adiutrix sp.]|jgi:flagellar basal-body rod protein FlgC|nr:flagellar basal body rod protein FlgC [Candidatus Adiutrix sp.]